MGLWTVRCGSLVCRPLVCKTAPDLSRSMLGSKTHRHGEWLSHHRPSTSPHMRACSQTALASQHRSISADNERIEATIWSVIDIPNRVRAERVDRLPGGNDFSLPRSHFPSTQKRSRVRHCFALEWFSHINNRTTCQYQSVANVCFTPNSDRESEIPQNAMSALPPKADMCSALAHVC